MNAVQRLWRSFGYALQGIFYTLKTQPNAKIHLSITVFVVILGLWLQISLLAWAVVVLTMGVVLAAEIFNTAIEAVVDLVSPEHHHLAKITKDAAAGAVLVTAWAAAVVGLLILLPPLWHKLLSEW